MVVVLMFFGYLLFGYGFCIIEVSKVMFIMLIELLVVIFFVIFLIGEVFKLVGWVGMMLVCFCFLI